MDPAGWKWCLGGTLVYYGAMSAIINCSKFIPDIDTGFEFYRNLYFRGLVNTTYFPLSQFVINYLLCIFGWTFVNLVTLKRGEPFTSGNCDTRSFK